MNPRNNTAATPATGPLDLPAIVAAACDPASRESASAIRLGDARLLGAISDPTLGN